MKLSVKERKWKAIIPEGGDPVKLADKIKAGMPAKFLKRLKAFK